MLTPEICAQSLTRRILGGAGTLSLVPLDIDSTVSIAVAAHGFDHHGQMVIACHVDDVACLVDGRVRLDGIKRPWSSVPTSLSPACTPWQKWNGRPAGMRRKTWWKNPPRFCASEL